MMTRTIIFILLLFSQIPLIAQEITLDKTASLEQVYMDASESESLMPMNDLNMEYGYILYQSEISAESENPELALENVRDYAAVYIDGKLQGTLTNSNKKTVLKTLPGKHQLQLYVENIGRITYGPEILDNSKGLFGSITLSGKEISNWKMIPLNIKNYGVENLTFTAGTGTQAPGFYKGTFNLDATKNTYLDISGWGMGEVWLNNKYLGSYWEKEKQQSIQIQSEDLVKGENELVVFELKNNRQTTMKLSENPIFK